MSEQTIEAPTTEQPPKAEGTAPEYSDGIKRMQEKFSKHMAEIEKAEAKPMTELKPKEQPAPAKEATKVEEPKHEVGLLTDEPPANISPKAGEAWKSFKAKANSELKTRESKIAELTQQIEGFKKTAQQPAVDPKEIETLRKANEQYDKELKMLAIERHPKFKAYYDDRIAGYIETAKKIVGENASALAKVLALPDDEYRQERIDKLADGLSPMRQADLAATIARMREVQSERAAELEKSSQGYQKMMETEKQQQEAAMAQSKAKIDGITKRGMEFAKTLDAFKTKDGDDAHNKEVSDRESFVQAFFQGKLPEEMLSWIPVLASEALFLKEKDIPRLNAEIKKRDEIIASYNSASPKPSLNAPTGEKPGQPKRFMDTWNQNYQPNH